jgi:enoyl-CoA hydratase/carnithine racemase
MSNITTEQKDGVLTVRFARIEKKNALTRAMYESLCDAFKKAEDSDDVRVLVLAGQEGIFTAGNDLADFLADPPSGEESPVFRFLRALVSFPKPLVASVDGPAIGLGTTLLLHCDAVVVTTRALLKMPFTQLGLVPEAASSALLPLIVGPVLARYWLLSSTGISGEEAYRTGLASHITSPEDLAARTWLVASEFASRPVLAMRESKKLMRAPFQSIVLEALTREAAMFTERLAHPEAVAAMMSFFEKKK